MHALSIAIIFTINGSTCMAHVHCLSSPTCAVQSISRESCVTRTLKAASSVVTSGIGVTGICLTRCVENITTHNYTFNANDNTCMRSVVPPVGAYCSSLAIPVR